jgi:hypothetical protein
MSQQYYGAEQPGAWQPAQGVQPQETAYQPPFQAPTYPSQAGRRAQPATGQLYDDLARANDQGKEFLQTMGASPITQLSLNYGKSMWDRSRMSSWFSLEPFKYYFNVNNTFVLQKLRVLACPFLHKSWKRQTVRQDELEFFCPPRDDVNAPDLYVPLMAFVTYILAVAFIMGANGQFSPELLGNLASRGRSVCFLSPSDPVPGVAVLFFEVVVIRTGFYFFDNVVEVSMLDLLAYSGYSFVLITANVLLGNIFGSFVYYISWLLASLFMATFIVRTLRLLIVTDHSKARELRNGFLLLIAGMQFLIFWLMGVLVSRPSYQASHQAPSLSDPRSTAGMSVEAIPPLKLR